MAKLVKKPVSYKLHPNTLDQIKKLAESLNDSAAGIIEKAIEEYYKTKEKPQ